MKWFSFVNDLLYLYKIIRKKSDPPLYPTEQEIFFLEPDYTSASITEPSSIKKATIVPVTVAALIFHLVLCVCILPIPLSLVGGIMADRELELRGVTTPATVINCTKTRSNRPAVTFTYNVTNSNGTPRQLTDEAFGNYGQFCVSVGTLILIQYLPDNPTATRLIEPGLFADNADIWLLMMTGLPVMLFVLAFVVSLARYIKGSLRYRKFVAHGMMLPGRVIQAGFRRRYGESKFHVDYEFTTPDQRTLRGTQSRVRLDLKAEKMAVPSAPVWVLYVDDHTYMLL